MPSSSACMCSRSFCHTYHPERAAQPPGVIWRPSRRVSSSGHGGTAADVFSKSTRKRQVIIKYDKVAVFLLWRHLCNSCGASVCVAGGTADVAGVHGRKCRSCERAKIYP